MHACARAPVMFGTLMQVGQQAPATRLTRVGPQAPATRLMRVGPHTPQQRLRKWGHSRCSRCCSRKCAMCASGAVHTPTDACAPASHSRGLVATRPRPSSGSQVGDPWTKFQRSLFNPIILCSNTGDNNLGRALCWKDAWLVSLSLPQRKGKLKQTLRSRSN